MVPADRATPSDLDIVGRTLELEALDRCLAGTTASTGGAVGLQIEGDAGIGRLWPRGYSPQSGPDAMGRAKFMYMKCSAMARAGFSTFLENPLVSRSGGAHPHPHRQVLTLDIGSADS